MFALANFIVGSILGPSGIDEVSKGFVGYNGKTFSDHLKAETISGY